jgi:2-C-methyl-D-erythritol 2,4-cyclodiphosphate synthase
MRIGHGFDAHRFELGEKLILGGVEISHTHGLSGHSDADVVIHAICDALLGAAALGDMGQHFPSTKEWRNASSRIFLQRVFELISKHHYQINNIDVTIIAQEPKLSPYREQMCNNIAEDLKITIDQVSVKATTTDGMGYTGQHEGIAAHAMVLLQKQNISG